MQGVMDVETVVSFSHFHICPHCEQKQLLNSMTRILSLLLVFVPYDAMGYLVDEDVKIRTEVIHIKEAGT